MNNVIYNFKKYIRTHEKIMIFLSYLYNFLLFNRFFGKKYKQKSMRGAFLKNCIFKNYGNRNSIVFREGCRLDKCLICFTGDGNSLLIEKDCVLKNVEIFISDGGKILIGNNVHTSGPMHIACIEGKTVSIGERCMFAGNLVIRTSDSHSIINEQNRRINVAKDVNVGNHVWTGQQVFVLKGAKIGDNCVVGTNTVVTGKYFKNNSVLVGNPARIVKENINWDYRVIK